MHPLVSPAWLADRLGASDTVILDATLPPVGAGAAVDTHGRYLEEHIPGAVFFDIERLSDPATSLPHMLPDAASFARELSAMGIADSQTIVVYEQGEVFSAPRARWMLKTMGAPEVYLLDGGLAAWKQAGLPLESGQADRAPSVFRAAFAEGAVKDFAQMQALVRGAGQILDARSAGRFAGSSPEPRAGIDSGHMPGSLSVPFTSLSEGARLQTVAQLREKFAELGVNLNEPITTTCGSGVTAAVVALALELVGAREVSVYDGSWAEYAQMPGAAIEKSS